MQKRTTFLLVLLMLVSLSVVADDGRFGTVYETFKGTANDSADNLPGAANFSLTSYAICAANLDVANYLWIKGAKCSGGASSCTALTVAADATDATCTNATGCAQFIVPPNMQQCFDINVNRISTDTAAGTTVAYVITILERGGL